VPRQQPKRSPSSLLEHNSRFQRLAQTKLAQTKLAQPLSQVRGDKLIIMQMRILNIEAVEFRQLPRRKVFARIKAPAAREQTLPPQNLVQPRDAAGEIMRRIKERRIRVGHFRRTRQQFKRLAIGPRGFDLGQQFDSAFRPHGPMSQQTAREP
jgi:hypothetical protein